MMANIVAMIKTITSIIEFMSGALINCVAYGDINTGAWAPHADAIVA